MSLLKIWKDKDPCKLCHKENNSGQLPQNNCLFKNTKTAQEVKNALDQGCQAKQGIREAISKRIKPEIDSE